MTGTEIREREEKAKRCNELLKEKGLEIECYASDGAYVKKVKNIEDALKFIQRDLIRKNRDYVYLTKPKCIGIPDVCWYFSTEQFEGFLWSPYDTLLEKIA